jgi:hypothetical protein
MRPTPWSEREFAFGRSLEEVPVLLERIMGTPARLLHLTGHEPPERLNLRRLGSWSVKEHIGHLILMQDRMEPRLDDLVQRRSQLSEVDLSDQGPIVAGHGRRALGDLIEEFRLKRIYFAERITAMEQAVLLHRADHPCTGRNMTVADILYFLAEHDDHHLALMRHLLQPSADVLRELQR